MGLFDMIAGGGDSGFDEARSAIEKNRRLYEDINLPEYVQYSPELYGNEAVNYETLSEDPLIRSSQMSLLRKMAGLSDTGLSDVDQAGFEKARSIGNQVAKSGTQSAIADSQRRGVGGSGLEFAMREAAQQSGAERAQDAGLQQSADSARNRMLYNQAFGNALSGVRTQDMNLEQANKGIINRFNELNTTNRNRINNANVDSRNEAFKYNEGLKDKNFQNQTRRADGIAGINNQVAQIGAAEAEQRRRRNSAIGGLAGAGIGAAFGGGAGAQVGAGIGQTLF